MKQCNKLIRKNKGQERVHDRAARRLICLTCDSGKAFDILLLHKESLSYFFILYLYKVLDAKYILTRPQSAMFLLLGDNNFV